MHPTIKYFSPADAEKTLPLVRKIVNDILIDASQIRIISSNFSTDIEKNPDLIRLRQNIEIYIRELEEIGCYYKDWNFEVGLVDFPSIINGEEVMLCWRSDEERIKFYHGIDEGYAGRKLIPESYFK